MNRGLKCNIVQDLLPNYIEELTSEETNHAIQEHLDTCAECKKVYDQMTTDIGTTDKVPKAELIFLKKVKKTRMIAAVLCVALTLVSAYLLYEMEFKYTIDKTDLSGAINEMGAFDYTIEAYVLETKQVDGVLLATFKDRTNENINGIARFVKGFNQKYRIIHSTIEPSDYSSIVEYYQMEIKDKQYTAVSGYNLSDEIKSYGLDFDIYSTSGNLSEDRMRESIKFDVVNQQFLEIYETEDLENLLLESVENTPYEYYLVSTSMYDVEGMEVTEKYQVKDDTNQDLGSVTGKVELFAIYVYVAMVLGLGIILTRYFLVE